MIEKIKIKDLHFTPFDFKHDIKRLSLKETMESVFPLFEKAYDISLTYGSRAEFSEDEDFINIKLEMNEKLAALRESYREYGFSPEDKEYINELNLLWNNWIKEFPVFKGAPKKVFVFWSLSFFDIVDIVFESKYKTVSMVDLFFFEKIIDYIVSEKEGVELKEEDISMIFKRFKAPIDHYRGLNLLLSQFVIESDNTREKIFDFYESLFPKLKEKVGKWEIILANARNHIIQKEYEKALKILEDNKILLLKEKPSDYINILIHYYFASENRDESLKLFNNESHIKELFSMISDDKDREKVSLIILSNFEIENEKTKNYLFNFIKLKDKTDSENIRLFVLSNIKQKRFDIIKEYLDYFEHNPNIIPEENLLYVFYEASKEIDIDFGKVKDGFVRRLLKGLEKSKTRNHTIILFLWEVILKRGLKDDEILMFLKSLGYVKEDFYYIYREREILKEYLKIREEVIEKDIVSVEEFKKYSFSEFAGDLFEKDLRKKIREKIKKGEKDEILPEAELILMRAPGDEEIFGMLI